MVMPQADELERFAALAEQLNLPIDTARLEGLRALNRMQDSNRRETRATLNVARRIKAESDGLAAHNEMLACALGACPECWGTIPTCSNCGGDGRPGAFAPDTACFNHFVMPAVRQFMIGRMAKASPEPAARAARPTPVQTGQENDDEQPE
jgi:hypothetical protein